MPALGSRYASHPIVKYVRSLPGGFLLPREAAVVLDIDRRNLRMLPHRRPGENLGPSHMAHYGDVVLVLYAPERIAAIHAVLAAERRAYPMAGKKGPVPLWTPAQVAARRRGYDRARKTVANAAGHRERGDEATAAEMEADGHAQLARLRAQARRRRAREAKKGMPT